MAKIVIEFNSLQEAQDRIDDVRQLFQRRNPLDEPHIELIEEKPQVGDAVTFDFERSTLVGIISEIDDEGYLSLTVDDAGFDHDVGLEPEKIIRLYKKNEHDVHSIEHPDNRAIFK